MSWAVSNYEGKLPGNLLSQITPFHMKFICPWNPTCPRFQLCEQRWLAGSVLVSPAGQRIKADYPPPRLNQGWGDDGWWRRRNK